MVIRISVLLSLTRVKLSMSYFIPNDGGSYCPHTSPSIPLDNEHNYWPDMGDYMTEIGLFSMVDNFVDQQDITSGDMKDYFYDLHQILDWVFENQFQDSTMEENEFPYYRRLFYIALKAIDIFQAGEGLKFSKG